MSKAVLSAGDPIEARCTKCRKITNHIVVAMADENPARVECNTCKGQHKYRTGVVKKKPTERRTADPKIAEQKEWEKRRTEIEGLPATGYSMSAAFKVGTVMRHPQFGLGLVQSKLGPQKVEVLFEDGKKKMRCL